MKNMLELSDIYRQLRDSKKQVEETLKGINAQLAEVEKQLAEAMVSDEVQNFSRDGILFYLSTRTYASAVAQRSDELHAWLKQNGYEGLVKENVNANTLSAFVREQLEEVDELPPELAELVHVYEKTGVTMRKA